MNDTASTFLLEIPEILAVILSAAALVMVVIHRGETEDDDEPGLPEHTADDTVIAADPEIRRDFDDRQTTVGATGIQVINTAGLAAGYVPPTASTMSDRDRQRYLAYAATRVANRRRVVADDSDPQWGQTFTPPPLPPEKRPTQWTINKAGTVLHTTNCESGVIADPLPDVLSVEHAAQLVKERALRACHMCKPLASLSEFTGR